MRHVHGLCSSRAGRSAEPARASMRTRPLSDRARWSCSLSRGRRARLRVRMDPRASSGRDRHGLLALLGAFTTWGLLLPLYLRELRAVGAAQIMAHRLVWCCLFVLAWLGLRGELGQVRRALTQPAT